MDFAAAALEDGSILAEIRAAAMEPSLVALGRFDRQKVRSRFLDTFVPADTWKIQLEGELVGFFVFRDRGDHLYLDHLYIHPNYQSQKLGGAVIKHLVEIATDRRLPIKLGALRNSPANQFYLRNGSIKTGEDEFDIYYEIKGHL